jgi:chromosome segregation ATPase
MSSNARIVADDCSDAASTRRALNAAQVQQTTLERKQFELERELRARADEVEEARRLAAKLRQEREILLDAETKLQREIEEREQQWGAERVSSASPHVKLTPLGPAVKIAERVPR